MKKILIGSLLAAVSMVSIADYTSGTNGEIPESVLEEELRVKINCLADPYSSQGDCDLPTQTEPFDGAVAASSSVNGSVMQTPQGFNTSDLTRVSFGYSGAEGSSLLEAKFNHNQNCDYLKSEIERSGYYGQLPISVPDSDGAPITLGDYVSYTCAANPELDIAETRVSGKKLITTGTEMAPITGVTSCNYLGSYFNDLKRISCANGDIFVFNTRIDDIHWYKGEMFGTVTEDYTGCDPYSTTKSFNCYYNSQEERSYKYVRYYDVIATPNSNSNDDQVVYGLDISYTFEKYRVYPIEDYVVLAPVDVSGITIFVPVPPESPNLGSTRVQYQGVSMTVGKRNLTEFWLGCEGKKEARSMEGGTDSLELRTFDLTSFTACETGFSAGFKNLATVEELFWYVDFQWGASEQDVWDKYATFLLDEVSDVFISTNYIENLTKAASQSTNDAKAVIETLSDYIKGNNTLTGLQGFLTIEGFAYGVNDPTAEINRLLIDSEDYGYGLLNMMEDGNVRYADGETNAGSVPAYWAAYLGSTFASNIGILDKLLLLEMAKDIIDTSGTDATLLASMQVVADAAQDELTQTIDKVVRFFDAIDARKAKGETFMTELESKFTELNTAANSADPSYTLDPVYDPAS